MVGRRRTPEETSTRTGGKISGPPQRGVDLNEIVAYNFRLARELRGWTQEMTAERLERRLGTRLPQASISAIERAFDGEKRREFDAQEIYVFAMTFDLPIVWFFLPPPSDHRTLRNSSEIVSELYGVVFGREDQLEPIYDRLRQIGIDDPTDLDRTIEAISGAPSPARKASYRERRKEMLLALLDDYSDEVDKAADEVGQFFDHLRKVGIRGFVAERLHDKEYTFGPDVRKRPRKGRSGGK
jgi:transcriptional regulator with XRE-family HTH domain